MPYASNQDLPEVLRSHLPEHAQAIFRTAFNRAWACYAQRDAGEREAICHRIAWAAVKRHYQKARGRWLPKGEIVAFPGWA